MIKPHRAARHVPKTFITVRTAEQVRDYIKALRRRVLRGEADNVDAIQEREDIRGNDLVDKHSGECCPEELDALVVGRSVEMEG